MSAIFFRLLATDDKGTALAKAILAASSAAAMPVTYATDSATFSEVPGTPFAYWVSETLRRKFTELPPFEGDGRTVKQGLATADDFRFVRAWWEVAPGRILDGANGPWQYLLNNSGSPYTGSQERPSESAGARAAMRWASRGTWCAAVRRSRT